MVTYPSGGGDDDGLLEVIFCPKKLALELVDISLSLLNVESAAGVGRLQLGHLREAEFFELQLCGNRIDLRLVRDGVDLEQHVAGLERLVGFDRNVGNLSGDIRNDRNRIAHHERRALGRAPSHRNEEAKHQQ